MPKITPKSPQSVPKVTPKSPESDPRVTPKWPQINFKVTRKRPETDPKVCPKSPSYVKSDPKSDVKLTSSSYKIIEINWENVCFLKRHFNIPKVTPVSVQSYHQVIQSHPQIPKLTPKSPQNDPRWARLAYLEAGPRVLVPSWKSKIRGKNVYFLFMGPFGWTSDPKMLPK